MIQHEDKNKKTSAISLFYKNLRMLLIISQFALKTKKVCMYVCFFLADLSARLHFYMMG